MLWAVHCWIVKHLKHEKVFVAWKLISISHRKWDITYKNVSFFKTQNMTNCSRSSNTRSMKPRVTSSSFSSRQVSFKFQTFSGSSLGRFEITNLNTAIRMHHLVSSSPPAISLQNLFFQAHIWITKEQNNSLFLRRLVDCFVHFSSRASTPFYVL